MLLDQSIPNYYALWVGSFGEYLALQVVHMAGLGIRSGWQTCSVSHCSAHEGGARLCLTSTVSSFMDLYANGCLLSAPSCDSFCLSAEGCRCKGKALLQQYQGAADQLVIPNMSSSSSHQCAVLAAVHTTMHEPAPQEEEAEAQLVSKPKR